MTSIAMRLPTAVRRGPRNPAFDVRRAELRNAAARMRSSPVALARPVVLLSGWRAWPASIRALSRNLRSMTSGRVEDFLTIAYPLVGDIDEAVRRTSQRIAERFPGESPDETAEVDVVAISMGGLVARAAAVPALPGIERPRVNIKRLFTLATPHRGARLAPRLAVDKAGRDMRPGSAFLTQLDAHLLHAGYELVCYTRLRDGMVGATNTSPPDRDPIWLAPGLMLNHVTIAGDPAITADIALRLRGEEPLAREGGAPPRD